MLTVLIYLLKMRMNAYCGITAAVIHGHNIEHNRLHNYTFYIEQKLSTIGRGLNYIVIQNA